RNAFVSSDIVLSHFGTESKIHLYRNCQEKIKMWTWQITQAQAGQSIHDFLKNEAAFSKRLIIKAKSETGLIAVNGEKKTVRYILAIDDNLTVQFPEEVPSESMYRTK